MAECASCNRPFHVGFTCECGRVNGRRLRCKKCGACEWCCRCATVEVFTPDELGLIEKENAGA